MIQTLKTVLRHMVVGTEVCVILLLFFCFGYYTYAKIGHRPFYDTVSAETVESVTVYQSVLSIEFTLDASSEAFAEMVDAIRNLRVSVKRDHVYIPDAPMRYGGNGATLIRILLQNGETHTLYLAKTEEWFPGKQLGVVSVAQSNYDTHENQHVISIAQYRHLFDLIGPYSDKIWQERIASK